MLDDTNGKWEALDLGFEGSPSGTGLMLVQGDEVHDAWVISSGYSPRLGATATSEVIALITLHGVIQTVFGYPNEEAYDCDPRGELGKGIYELKGSRWYANLREYNERTYWRGHKYMEPHRETLAYAEADPARHFFMGSKDDSVQALCTDLSIELFPTLTFREVFDDAVQRFWSWGD